MAKGSNAPERLAEAAGSAGRRDRAARRRRWGKFGAIAAVTAAGVILIAAILGGERIANALGRLALDEVNAQLPSGQIVAEDIHIRWNWRQLILGIEFAGVRYEIQPGSALAAAERVGVGVSLEEVANGRISADRIAIDGLTAFIDAGSPGGPFVAARDSDHGLPLMGLFGAARSLGPGPTSRIDVTRTRLDFWSGYSHSTWHFDEIGVDRGVLEDGAFIELSANLQEPGGHEEGWIELKAEWGAGQPPTASLAFGSLSAQALVAAVADPALPLPTLTGLAVAGTAHFEIDSEFRLQMVEGGLSATRVEPDEPGVTSGLQLTDLQFRYDPAHQQVIVSRVEATAGALRALGEVELELQHGRPGFASGGLQIAVRGEPESGSGGLDEADAAIEFAYHPDRRQLDVPQFWIRVASGEATGSAAIAEFNVTGDEIAGRIEQGQLSVTAFGGGIRGTEGLTTRDRTTVISSVAGDFQCDLDTGQITADRATGVAEDAAIKVEGFSFPILDMAGPITGRVSADSVIPGAVAAVWPPSVAAKARDWFKNNVESGRMNAEINLSGTRSDPLADGTFTYSEAAFTPSRTMPQIRGASGRGQLDSSRFHVSLNQGYLSEAGERFDVMHAAFEISDLAAEPLRAIVEVEGGGPPGATLRIARRFGVQLLDELVTASALNVGHVGLGGQIHLLLDDPVSIEASEFSVEARGLGFESEKDGFVIRDADVDVVFGSGAVTATGAASVNGAEVTFEAEQRDSRESPDGGTLYAIQGLLEVPPALDGILFGNSLPYRLEVWPRDEETKWQAILDTEGAGIRFGESFLKQPGVPGTVEASGSLGAHDVSVSSVAARFPQLSLAGDRTLDGNGGWQFSLSGGVDASVLARSGLPVRGSGSVPLTVDVIRRSGLPIGVALQVELDSTSLELEGLGMDVLGIRAEPGTDSHISATGVVDGEEFVLREFTGSLGGLAITGEALSESVDSPEGHWRADVQISDSSRFTVEVRELGAKKYRVDLVGDVLDISGKRQQPAVQEANSARSEFDEDHAGVEIELRIRVRRLQVTADMWMEAASGRLILARDGSLNGSIHGLALGSVNGEVLISQASGSQLGYVVSLDDAGSVLNALGITSKAEGGKLQVTPLDGADPSALPSYRVQATGLKVGNAPLIGKLMAFISGIGLIEYVLTGNIRLNSVVVNVTEDGDLLRLTEGSVESDTIAVAFAGDYNHSTDYVDIHGYGTPLRFISRVLGELPVLGNVVQGPGGKGIIGVGFRVTGASDDPEVVGSPLDLLIPLLPQLRYQQETTEAGTPTTR